MKKKKESIINKEKIKIIVFCLLVSFVTLLFCSKNSPLYPMNDWGDENAFFTVARSWLHGIIPYKDIFEQKGPVLYLIFLVASLISSKSFIGVFIIEVLFYATFAYLIGKISDLYLKKEFKFIIIPLILTFIASTKAFAHGGSAEEFVLPMLTYFIYKMLVFFKTDELTRKDLIILGFIAGLIALIKYTLLGLPFIFMASIFFIYLFRKEYKKAILNCIYFLIGMGLPIFIFLVYFICTRALSEFIEEYIMINIKYYPSNYTLSEKFGKICKYLYNTIKSNGVYTYILLIANILLIYGKAIFKNKKEKVIYVLMILFAIIGIYWGCLFIPYYFLGLELFLILPTIYIFKLLEKKITFNKKNIIIATIIVLIISIINFSNYQYKYFSKVKKEDLAQYKFAKIMNKKKDATLLNYMFLDGGFYLAADIDPTIFAFEKQNIDFNKYPYLDNMQNIAILEKKVDFVVMRLSKYYKEIPDFVLENYKIVSTKKQKFEDINFEYVLLEKIEDEEDNN